jgi:HK97 family phage prohead protease
MSIERRAIESAEVRAEGTAAAPKITGFIPYNTRSVDLGGFTETIKPGAFADLASADVRGRYNHELVLGRNKAGTLKLTEEAGGLRYEITPPATAMALHAWESIRRGDVSGSSFAFQTIGDEWRMVDGKPLRELTKVALLDVGPVDFPAYPDSTAAARSVTEGDPAEFRSYVAEKIAALKQPTPSPMLDAARAKLAMIDL